MFVIGARRSKSRFDAEIVDCDGASAEPAVAEQAVASVQIEIRTGFELNGNQERIVLNAFAHAHVGAIAPELDKSHARLAGGTREGRRGLRCRESVRAKLGTAPNSGLATLHDTVLRSRGWARLRDIVHRGTARVICIYCAISCAARRINAAMSLGFDT